MADDSTYLRTQAQRREQRAKTKALTVDCWCGAKKGQPCGRESDKTRVVHLTRYAEAMGLR